MRVTPYRHTRILLKQAQRMIGDLLPLCADRLRQPEDNTPSWTAQQVEQFVREIDNFLVETTDG